MSAATGAVPQGAASAEEQAAFQAGLWELLAAQTARYTMGESSSVPMDTARELLRSIQFCIGMAPGGSAEAGQPPKGASAELFEQGLRQVWLLAEEGKLLLGEARRTALPIGNLSYRDTLEALPGFFRMYDIRYFAHDIPCMIDYQLLCPVPEELLGISFIGEYLHRLIAENRFCRCFDTDTVIRLLRAYCPDYQGLLINICDAVFTNAVGLALLGRDPLPLAIDAGGCAALLAMFRPWNGEAAVEAVRKAVARLCNRLGILDTRSRDYLQQAGRGLVPRIRATSADAFHQLFLSFL